MSDGRVATSSDPLLALDRGSSRIKFALFEAAIVLLPRPPMRRGKLDGINRPSPRC